MRPRPLTDDKDLVMRLRLVFALLAVSIVAVVALAAPSAISRAASPNASAAKSEYCPAGEADRRKAVLARFVKHMKANRRKFFRTHHSRKARARFVKKQLQQLHALQRAAASCD
jgi:hypothetical protein